MPGAMNKANARQHMKNGAHYDRQPVITARNKARRAEAQERFQERKRGD